MTGDELKKLKTFRVMERFGIHPDTMVEAVASKGSVPEAVYALAGLFDGVEGMILQRQCHMMMGGAYEGLIDELMAIKIEKHYR
jgi:hypothetical protein